MIELPADLTRSTKVLLVMEVVESVRIMEQDQDDFVRRWQQLVEEVEQRVLPLHSGRIVKNLGDGLMLEFASAQGCVKAAFDLHSFTRQANLGVPPEYQMHLRMGGHLASFVTNQHDVYGTDANLTSRVSTLAGPGEPVVTADMCRAVGTFAGRRYRGPRRMPPQSRQGAGARLATKYPTLRCQWPCRDYIFGC